MRLSRHLSTMMTTTLVSSVGSVRLIPTPAERARGRYMRAPDGHDGGGAGDAGGASSDAGAGDGAAAGAAADGAGAAGGSDQGGGSGAGGDAGAGGGSDQGAAGDQPGTILGEAAAGDDAGDGKGGEGEGEAGAEAGKEGEDGGSAVEVLGAPEKYELTVPDAMAAAGVTFDAEAFAEVEPVLRELNLSNDAAQALVNAYAGKVLPLLEKRAGERWDTTGADMRRGWAEEARNDPEIGGAKFDETKALARQTFTRFGVKADGPFLKLLEESGLGSHPDMLRFVANVGRLTGEATTDTGGSGQAQVRLADRVYGKPTPRE